MTIQRQYSLPNCQLVVEGVSQDAAPIDLSGRPPISLVTHVECRVAGHSKPLMGGRDLLEGLVTAVSEYAQEYLSGIAHPAAHPSHRGRPELVQLQRVDSNLHRLTVQPQINNPEGKDKSRLYQAPPTPAVQLDLTTVQLFDMVEAIDQFFADTQTVPELSLRLDPLPKRYAAAQEPLAKRALPAALGVSSVAVAALALFYLPIPEVKRPSNEAPATQTTPSPGSSPSPTGASPTPSPSAAAPSPTASPAVATSPTASPVAASPTTVGSTVSTVPSPVSSPVSGSPAVINGTAASPTSPTSSPTTATSGTQTPPSSQELEAILQSAPEITDPSKLGQLVASLQEQLYRGWQEKPAPTFTENLVYRVGVAENGDILGFKFANDPALAHVKETPLLDLRYNPTEASGREPIAQFRVVFRPDEILEISPWYGEAPESNPAPSPR